MKFVGKKVSLLLLSFENIYSPAFQCVFFTFLLDLQRGALIDWAIGKLNQAGVLAEADRIAALLVPKLEAW